MSTQLFIPDFALVTVLSQRRDQAFQILKRIHELQILELDLNQPEAVKASVFEALDAGATTGTHLHRSHPALRRSLSKWAKSAGAAHVIIIIDEAEALLPDERHPAVYQISSSDIDSLTLTRIKMPVDLRHLKGPFDIIGDIHGCTDELLDLLVQLGHATKSEDQTIRLTRHVDGRRVCLVGDLTDRGPKNRLALETAYRLQQEFGALLVLGNHDHKLMRWLRGSNVRQAAGLQLTVAELEALSTLERKRYADWLAELPTHLVLDDGRLVIAHAGLAEQYHGRASSAADAFALYGEKSGEIDADGIPLTKDWAQDYRGDALVVHGHTVSITPRQVNNVISIDTGCVFGGQLTAFRYPEHTFHSVPARAPYFQYRPRTAATETSRP